MRLAYKILSQLRSGVYERPSAFEIAERARVNRQLRAIATGRSSDVEPVYDAKEFNRFNSFYIGSDAWLRDESFRFSSFSDD